MHIFAFFIANNVQLKLFAIILPIFCKFIDFFVKITEFYGIINTRLYFKGGFAVREFEKYYCDYIVLGIPDGKDSFFIKFFAKKQLRPTVYAEAILPLSRLLALAKFCRCYGLSNDGITNEILQRHSASLPSKKKILIYTAEFKDYVARNQTLLEKSFLIYSEENI